MKQLLQSATLLLGILLLAASCKQQEVVTVTQQPELETPAEDTTGTADAAPGPASPDFLTVGIGETTPIHSLDPLHAENGATLRAVQLVYEGLFRYDAEGTPQPVLAEDWEQSEDSLTWRFTVDTNLFYHDSPIFSDGVGRRFRAGDIKFTFQRMAWNNVPPHAARMFMHIRGFEPFFSEQHTVYNPELRRLGGVSGIEVPNDSTVVFRLAEPDPQFIHKLASPYAVIYPPEAITTPYPSQFPAVGTGPFSPTRQQGDSLIYFSRNTEYHEGGEGLPNRIDMRFFASENRLFRAFASGEIQLIPHTGPQTLATILESDGQLSESYRSQYVTDRSELSTRYRIRHHPGSPFSRRQMQELAGFVDSAAFGQPFPYELMELRMERPGAGPDSLSAMPAMPDSIAQVSDADSVRIDSVQADSFPADSIFATFSDDQYLRNFITHWSNNLRDRGVGVALQMLPIRAVTRNTALYTEIHHPQHPGDVPDTRQYPGAGDDRASRDSAGMTAGDGGDGGEALIEWTIPRVSIYHNSLTGLRLNRYPWWIDVRGVSVNTGDSGGEQP